jgi:tyrosinase
MPSSFSRRTFLETSAAGLAASALPLGDLLAAPRAKYIRYNITSREGQAMLVSYAKGVKAMMNLKADNPQNWFRNAFIHLMDCPHGNWWFYVWHRGYLGFFERTIRNLSGDENFAVPYWDWTQTPYIPDSLFDGILTPTDAQWSPYTQDLTTFTNFVQPDLQTYFNGLTGDQKKQQDVRGYTDFQKLWNDVTGNGVPGNEAFATTAMARYLTRENPHLDKRTSFDVSWPVILAGLLPIQYNTADPYLSFTSSRTDSHEIQPGSDTKFSVLEGFPHNKVHNCIGGVRPDYDGPYGFMTNFLSPCDPIFFMHHSNMDRLWDVWTRKQLAIKQPILPTGADWTKFGGEPFRFYVDGNGGHITDSHAKDYVSTAVFDYAYAPGTGEKLMARPKAALMARRGGVMKAKVQGGAAMVSVPGAAVRSHLVGGDSAPLAAEVTLAKPTSAAAPREYDVLVNAPAGTTSVDPTSPYYAGTIAFFGFMGMEGMGGDATFAVPLPKTLTALTSQKAKAHAALNIQLVPANGTAAPGPSVLKALSVVAP